MPLSGFVYVFQQPPKVSSSHERSNTWCAEEFENPTRLQDVGLMPSDTQREMTLQSTKSLENELAKLQDARKNCELRLLRLPGNPKKAKEKEAKEQLEEEVEKMSSQINSLFPILMAQQ